MLIAFVPVSRVVVSLGTSDTSSSSGCRLGLRRGPSSASPNWMIELASLLDDRYPREIGYVFLRGHGSRF